MLPHRALMIASLFLLISPAAPTQSASVRMGSPTTASPLPNSDATYQQLRRVAPGGESIAVSDFTLRRDAATFVFGSGTFYLLAPVNGKVTGAVFLGNGSLKIVPPTEMERRNIAILTKSNEYVEIFDTALLRFTDGTERELRAAGKVGEPAGSAAGDALEVVNAQLRNRLRFNLHARLLQDVLSQQPGGFFAAFIQGRPYSGRTLFVIDPHAVPEFTLPLAPEEVALMTYDDKFGVWASFHLADEYGRAAASSKHKNAWIDVDVHELETRIEKSGRLEGSARTTFLSGANGLRVVMFDLYPTLCVLRVAGANGEPLAFIQEDKEKDATFAVILPREIAARRTLLDHHALRWQGCREQRRQR